MSLFGVILVRIFTYSDWIPDSVRIQENADQNNFEYGHFFCIYTLQYSYFEEYSLSEVVFRKCFIQKVFLKFSQNSQENNSARISFLIKQQALGYNFFERETIWHRCFPVNLWKYEKTQSHPNVCSCIFAEHFFSNGCFRSFIKL